jgi:hypothetical protein
MPLGPIKIVELIHLDRDVRAVLPLLEKVRLEGVEVLLRTVAGIFQVNLTILGWDGSVQSGNVPMGGVVHLRAVMDTTPKRAIASLSRSAAELDSKRRR